MPTSSSDSEGTSQRPRRRAATRSTTTPRRTSTRTPRTSSADDVEAATPAPIDDDFGSGVDEQREARLTREKRKVAAPEAASAEDAPPSAPRAPRVPRAPRERRPRRDSSADREATADTPEPASDGDRPERGQRTSSRFERNIADVEPQTGMRYFSTDELDFGDDDVEPVRSAPSETPRSRPRYRSDEPVSDRRPNPRGPSEDQGDFVDDGEGDRGPADGPDVEGGPPRQGEYFDADRRPRRRRRRRRRPDGPVNDGPVRTEPGRYQGGPRPENNSRRDGGRGDSGRGDSGRRDSGRGDSGRNDGGRGRRGRSSNTRDGQQPRGGGGRDSGRGRDPGGIRRSRPIQPSTEVIEGTFEGVLELHPRGYGFLRDPKKNYAAEDSNPFVSSSLVEKYKLREGVLVRGDVGQGTRNQGPRLREVELIDGFTPEEYLNVKQFDQLTAINPFEQIKLEVGPRPLTMRVMDLLCPIGKGQRALLVAPPRTGKTMLLQDIANSVSINHPEIHLMVLLIDERPEEVTEMRRMVKGEVISSSLDSDVESHIRISELIIERAKRLAEEGKDVFILLDSITRLARAFNKANNTGRTGTGGLDIRALDIPKKMFGQARRFDEGGSLTVCGTALIDTGGRMDEAIFQEFKGTGNMEMVLSRELADRRIWPSIDITKSGTRREEKILAPDLLEGIIMLRRSLISLNPVEAMEQLTKTMEKFPTNREFLSRIKAVL